MMNSDSVRLAVIGGGGWGKNLIRNFVSLERADLRYICDLDEHRLTQYKELYPGVSTTTDFEHVLHDESIKAVVIATPADTHFSLIKQALATGRLHVFTEKPLALRLEEAAELVELSENTGLTLMVGHLLLYHPAVRRLRELITSDELGDIYCIYSSRLNLGAIRKVENAWWSLAPHDISILHYLLDETPLSVAAQGQHFIQPGIADLVFATLDFPNRAIAQVHVSWLDPHKMRQLTIVGSKKMVIFDDMEAVEKIKIYDKGVTFDDPVVGYDDFFSIRTGDLYVPHLPMREPLKLECEHFLDCVLTGETPLTDAKNGYAVVAVLNAGEESMNKSGAPVEIKAI
ncbi:Gfo/Idh/MocA family protein [candidate division KSB1 bacterium]